MKANLETIVIAANFTIEPISHFLQNVLRKVSIHPKLVIAPYNQVFQQLLDPGSLFHNNGNGVNKIFLRLEDLVDRQTSEFKIDQTEITKIRTNASELAKWLKAAEHFKVPLFVFICPPSLKIQADPILLAEFQEIQHSLKESVSNVSNMYVFETDHLIRRYKIDNYDNPKGNRLGHIPYSSKFFSALAIETVRKVDVFRRNPFKVLVLDCDNTLWDGVVGEDGVDGIGLSDKRLFLQNFAVKQSESGMIVCLCSKNNEADVWDVFDQRKEMALKKEHIVSSRINWLSKSENLRSIAEELRLGLESFIFVDDDAAVCSEVQMNCPEVFTILLPPTTEDYSNFFDHLWVFDKLKVTKEDRERTRSYQNQVVRNELQAKAGDMAEFLKSLALVCQISEIRGEEVARVSQLSLRTNQFNSTTVRLTESDIRRLISEEKKDIWTVNVSDRFGDYGLVGVVILEKQVGSVDVESLMLSCRVLGRGVEHRILQELGKKAVATKREFVNIRFQPTAKNVPILNFLTEIGGDHRASGTGQTIYQIPARAALDCSPKTSRAQNKSTHDIEPSKYANVPKGSYDNGLFQVYLELAESLTENRSLEFGAEITELSRRELRSEFRAARDVTETKLTRIWEKLLNTQNIGIADNFFEMGGDSLIAVSLFVEIEEQFGKPLPLSSLINSPTIEKLAQSIEVKTDSNEWKYLVPIRSEGTMPPLFCMHAAGGNVLNYLELASELGNDQPVYGLQMRGVTDKSETAHDRVEEMAKEYLREIRRLQPEGPYRLCGASFGGLVAYETARQLSQTGESVSFLALIDTYAPGYLNKHSSNSSMLGHLNRRIEKVKFNIFYVSELPTGRERFDYIFNRVGKIKGRLKRKINWKKNEIAIEYNLATGKELPNDMLKNIKAIKKAEQNYRSQPYDGEMILFRASIQPKDAVVDPFLGWKKYTSQEIVIEDVKGNHNTVIAYPFVAEFAGKFNYHLNEPEIL